MNKKGQLIVLEGLDYSGKTTQIDFVVGYLRDRGFKVETFREPGGTEVGEQIRSILKGSEMDPMTELLLFSSARMELITKKIQPLLKQGYVVVLDRFIDSTYAYQGHGRSLISPVTYIERLITEFVKPDIVFYLDVDLDVIEKRQLTRRESDRFDLESREFRIKVKQGYTERLAHHPERTVRINANLSTSEVGYQIMTWLNNHFIPLHKDLKAENL